MDTHWGPAASGHAVVGMAHCLWNILACHTARSHFLAPLPCHDIRYNKRILLYVCTRLRVESEVARVPGGSRAVQVGLKTTWYSRGWIASDKSCGSLTLKNSRSAHL